MARPHKEIESLRIHQVNIRLTNAEREFANQQAEMAGLSIANWIRRAAFSKKPLKLKVSPLHRDYYRRLVGVSNNINQLTHRVNSGQYTKIHSLLVELQQLLTQINKALINDR